MRIAFFIDSLGSGGAQRQAVEIARQLARRHGVHVAFGVYHDIDFYGPRLRELGIPVALLRKRARFDPSLVWRIRRWLREERVDLVHAFLLPPSAWCLAAVKTLSPQVRPVFVAAERSALIARSPGSGMLQRWVYGASDAVTANAASVAEEIRSKLGIARDRVHYVPNGIDLERWDAEARTPPPLPLEPGRFQIALVGGLRREKNHALLLAALARVEAVRREGWRVWFIGGETGSPEEAAAVHREIGRLGLADVVRVAPPTPQIASVMTRLDAVVMPSDFEGFPNILLEAMASRVATVATTVGDVPNMVDDGTTGMLVPPRDVEALTGALERLARMTRAERQEMGARARVVVEQRYRIDVVAERHLALYESLLSARHGVLAAHGS